MIVATTSVTNGSRNDHQPITGLIVPVEPNARYLIEYVLKVAAGPGTTGIHTLADGPVGTEVAVQDGIAFDGDLDAAMICTLTGLATTADVGGHVMLYFVPAGNDGAIATIVEGSMARVTRS